MDGKTLIQFTVFGQRTFTLLPDDPISPECKCVVIIRGYNMAVFVSAHIYVSSFSVDIGPRRSQGLISTESLISGLYENSRVIISLSCDQTCLNR